MSYFRCTRLDRLTPIHIEWNDWNGFIFEFLGIETISEGYNYPTSLFGLSFSRTYIQVEFLFFNFYWEF